MIRGWLALGTLWLLPPWLDPAALLHLFGPWAIVGGSVMLFAECVVVPFLPGDTLLFTVGLFSANHDITTPLWLSCLAMSSFAFLGNLAGYGVGRFFGPLLFKSRQGLAGRIFDPHHIVRAKSFLDRYGTRAVVMARFVPFVRTFMTWVAGAARMRIAPFLIYTAVGGALWVAGLTSVGYYLGRIDVVGHHLNLALLALIVITTIPIIVQIFVQRHRARTSGNREQADQRATHDSLG